ncbi:tetratricopeptide repeat protein [Fibrobacter sp. UBA4309]|uniref:tetratricopeptide repeat protein n=1 Tax=Fibrobacter sp. UBA4309 TaxID=1946537 RepID=UPI0025C0DFBF|nr:tetratricopeptide repeat protein [Fibrobacter sp. UBA4309]
MMSSTVFARKAAYLFLILCVGMLISFGAFRLYEDYGPSKVSVEAVPFGLPAGSSFVQGDAPDLMAGFSEVPVQTQAELRRAVELFRGGNTQAAYEILEAVVQVYPALLWAAWNEENTLFEMDSLDEPAKERMRILDMRLQAQFPNTGLSSYLDSRKAYLAGNTSLALQLARVATEKAPSLYEARLWFARLLKEDGRLAQAGNECHAAISLSLGADPRTYELMAQLYHDQGLLDSSASLVEYALSQYPANVELLLLQGYLMEYQGRFDSAEKLYHRILAFRPDFAKASTALASLGEKSPPGTGSGVTLSPKDRAQVACDILEPLVEKYPENLPLREALGLALLKGREFDRARIQFREILNRDPEYPDIQQRIQESNVTKPAPVAQNSGLAENLSRAVDSLRGAMGPATKHDFTTMLGHYLVRYGATPGEFFKKYAVGNFRPVKANVWQESFYEPPYKHTYTIVFDSLNHFREVHVSVFDSSTAGHHLGIAPEVFTRLLKQNSRISGIGNSTGETDCGDGNVIDAAVWETQDNFEILARFVGKPAEVRMVRFDKSALVPGLKLCDYIPYLNEY